MRNRGILVILPLAVVTLMVLAWLALRTPATGDRPQTTTGAPAAEAGRPTAAPGRASEAARPGAGQPAADAPSATPPATPTAAIVGSGGPLLPTPTLAGETTNDERRTTNDERADALRPTPAPGQGARPTLPPLSPDLDGPVVHGGRDAPRIALTFDACQDPDLPAGYDAALIQVLLDTGTPATLFLGGDWMRTHPEETRFLAAQPQFELGNHGYAHIDFAAATGDEMWPEIEQTQQIMWELVGRQPRVFRFPGGTYTAEALAVAAELGVQPIEWEVVSGDPDPDITAERMIPWVVNQVQNGSIIIMHMNGRGWHTAEALPDIIAQLREMGFEFVTVSELVGVGQ